MKSASLLVAYILWHATHQLCAFTVDWCGVQRFMLQSNYHTRAKLLEQIYKSVELSGFDPKIIKGWRARVHTSICPSVFELVTCCIVHVAAPPILARLLALPQQPGVIVVSAHRWVFNIHGLYPLTHVSYATGRISLACIAITTSCVGTGHLI